MKRPFLVAVIGYIIGIIWGLYFQFSIVLLYIFITAIYLIVKFLIKNNNQIEKSYNNLPSKAKLNLFSLKRYFRYLKIVIKPVAIYSIIIISIISNYIINYLNNKYDTLFTNIDNPNIQAIVVSNKVEKQYYDRYKIKILNLNNDNKFKNIYLYINVNKKYDLNYGDYIKIIGEFIEPNTRRNYRGFDYKLYLKTLKIYGTIQVESIELIEKNKTNSLLKVINNLVLEVKKNAKNIMSKDIYSIFLGLILGDNTQIEEEIKENFKVSNISHVLAISGMHISYLVLGINILFKKIIGKRSTKFVTILILIIYMFITNFSPSILRAGIMGALVCFSNLFYRKNDVFNSISLSLFLILLYNPFLITNVGVQLSYGGTLGIILFQKKVYDILGKIKLNKVNRVNKRVILRFSKVLELLKQSLSVSISAQLIIFPILIYHFHSLGLYVFINNLLVSLIIAPIVIFGFIELMFLIININLAKCIYILFSLGANILIKLAEVGANLPYAQIYVVSFPFVLYFVYYILVFLSMYLFSLYNSKNINSFYRRVRNIIALIIYKIKQNKTKLLSILVIIAILFFCIYKYPKNLRIYFLDVGQGDSTFIVTPRNKKILIDGGGSENYDVGKNVLLPYILSRGYTTIDCIVITHFDQDHVGGIFTVLENLKVKCVVISKQIEESDNYNRFLEIVNKKKINVKIVKKGDKIKIEKDIYLHILWPEEEQITENVLNNNAIVCKLIYNDFSMLFTGDIEEIAEKRILEEFKNTNILKSTVLKVAHHGSKSSSMQSFLEEVKPKVALIGVGENNTFGHPNEGVLNRLKNLNIKIYRTDTMGEITLEVNKKGRIKIETPLMRHV